MKHCALLVLAVASIACGAKSAPSVSASSGISQPTSSEASDAAWPTQDKTAASQKDQTTKGGLTHKSAPSISYPPGPVTEGEAKKVFARTADLLKASYGANGPAGPSRLTEASRPATRQALIQEMVRLYKIAEPKFKLTPKPIDVNESVVKVDGAARSDALSLIRLGALANYGPLATGPGQTVTVDQFGDALGFFICRIAEMTHMPLTKWTPLLKDAAD